MQTDETREKVEIQFVPGLSLKQAHNDRTPMDASM